MRNGYFEEIINGKKIILFGAGEIMPDFVSSYLEEYKIAYVCDNDCDKWNKKIAGVIIYPPSKILKEDRKDIIVLVSTSQYQDEIMIWLLKHSIPCIDINFVERLENVDVGYIGQDARKYFLERCSNKKLIIYGTGDIARKISRLCLHVYNIKTEYFIDNQHIKTIIDGKSVKSLYDIVYEKPDKYFIIIANDKESYSILRQKFIHLGLIEDINFTYYKELVDEYSYESDATLSYNRVKVELEGFELFGDTENPEVKKIVALGGSATESEFLGIRGWASYLADMLSANGFSVCIYCGGVSGYNSTQELLKLIRDVLPLNPAIILSYNGINDIRQHPKNTLFTCHQNRVNRPFITEYQADLSRDVFYGLENNKNPAECYVGNIKTMYSISNEFDLCFLSFLQPFFFYGNYMMSELQSIAFNRRLYGWKTPSDYTQEQIKYLVDCYDEIREYIKDIDYAFDLTNIFNDCKDIIYRDAIHVTERGNEIIAKNIYQVLVNYLRD